jgi:hypothetical protein
LEKGGGKMVAIAEKDYVISEDLMSQFSQISCLIQSDPEFKELLYSDPKAAFESKGINIPAELTPDKIDDIDMLEYLDFYCGVEFTTFKRVT